MLEAALKYAAQGYRLIPCHTPLFQSDGSVKCSCSKGPACPYKNIGKHPRTMNGLSDASSNIEQVRAWWTKWPNANIAWLPESKMMAAFDIDSEKNKASARSMGLYSEPTMECQTANGTHRYYTITEKLVDGSMVGGIILRSGAGYVLLPPSLHASGKRYEWCDDAEAIPMPDDAMAEALKSSSKEGAKERVARALSGERIGPGERHAALLTVAGSLAGRNVPADVAQQLVQAWNVTHCDPPKDEAEIANMITYVYNEERKKVADISKHLVLSHAPKQSLRLLKPEEKAPNPLDAPLPGVLEGIVQWSLRTAPSPVRLYSVAAALAIASTICARRYATTAQNYSSLYFLIIGKSGTGKEHARVSAMTFLKKVGAGHLVGPNEWTSRAAVWATVYQQPQSLAIIDEFGQFMGSASGGGDTASMKNGVLTGVMELFGRVHDTAVTPQYATTHHTAKQREDSDRKVIERPALSLLAMTTPDEWYGALKATRISSGFLNRFLVLESDATRGDLAFADVEAPSAELCEWAQTLLAPRGNLDTCTNPTMVPDPVRLGFTDEANDAFTNFRRQCNARADSLDKERLGVLPMRANEQAMRLALVSALARNPAATMVDEVDAAWGIRVSDYLIGLLVPAIQNRLADGDTHALHNALLQELREKGGRGMTATELQRARSLRNAKKHEREYAIQWVQQAEYAAWGDVPHKGAGAPRYALIIQAIKATEDAA